MWYLIGMGSVQIFAGTLLTQAKFGTQVQKNLVVGSFTLAGAMAVVAGIGVAIFRGLST